MGGTTAQAGFTVRLARSGTEVHVPAGGSILAALLEAGIEVPWACGAGVCGACWQRVVSGVAEHRDWCLTDEQHARGAVMICCAGSRTPTLELDL